jgi:CheY-like chemotaxis protein
VADDEEPIRDALGQILESLGFSVLKAADGRRAVAMFQEHADEIVLSILDASMPAMGGVDAGKAIRRMQGDAKIILSSGYFENEIGGRFASVGFTGFLNKPFRAAELRKKIADALASSG